MALKHLLAAAVAATLAVPSLVHAQAIQVTEQECEDNGGTVNEEEGTCVGANLTSSDAAAQANGLGQGLGGGEIAAIAAAVLVVGLAAGGGDSSTTTTTTTTGD